MKRQKNDHDQRYGDYPKPIYDQIIPYAVLGLSLGALGLSVYTIVGGPADNYIASRQSNIVHATEEPSKQESETDTESYIDEILGEGEYDISIKVDDDGKRSYVLTPKSPDEVDSDTDTNDTDDKSKDTKNDEKESEKGSDDKKDKASSESKDNDESKEDNLSDEAQAKLDEHKSMRLRIRPDRDGDDIYYYVVEPGDTLAMISEFFGVPLGQLMEENFIEDGNMIYVGEVIFMPVDYVG